MNPQLSTNSNLLPPYLFLALTLYRLHRPSRALGCAFLGGDWSRLLASHSLGDVGGGAAGKFTRMLCAICAAGPLAPTWHRILRRLRLHRTIARSATRIMLRMTACLAPWAMTTCNNTFASGLCPRRETTKQTYQIPTTYSTRYLCLGKEKRSSYGYAFKAPLSFYYTGPR